MLVGIDGAEEKRNEEAWQRDVNGHTTSGNG